MSRHKDLFQTINQLELDETPYAIASVFQVHGSSSGKVGDKAIFDNNGNRGKRSAFEIRPKGACTIKFA